MVLSAILLKGITRQGIYTTGIHLKEMTVDEIMSEDGIYFTPDHTVEDVWY